MSRIELQGEGVDNMALEVDFYLGDIKRGIQGVHVTGRPVCTPRWLEGEASSWRTGDLTAQHDERGWVGHVGWL